MSEANQPIEIGSIAMMSLFDRPLECTKRNAYRVFVTGVPVNIHRYLARSWATTLLARVALKHVMSSVARH